MDHPLALALACAAVLFIPGFALLQSLDVRLGGLELAAASLCASVACVPLAMLWSGLLGLAWTAAGVRVALAVMLAAAALLGIRNARRPRQAGLGASIERRSRVRRTAELATVVMVAAAALLRGWDASVLEVPAWVDGYHHTLVTQTIVERGGVPSDLRPYLELDRFYYHFGFHAVAALVAWPLGIPSWTAVLAAGQALAAASVLATWWLAWRLIRRPWAAAFAGAVPAFLYLFPAYFVAWGRYTQLAGLVVLPAAWLFLWDALGPHASAVVQSTPARDLDFQAARPSPPDALGSARRSLPRMVVLAGVVAAGLVLVHYRVAAIFAIGALVVGVARAVSERDGTRLRVVLRFATVVAIGGALVAPWLAGNLLPGAGSIAASTDAWYAWSPEDNRAPAWLVTQDDNPIWLAAAAIGLLTALLRGRRPAYLVLAVVVCLAAAAFPERLGIPPSWMLPRFAIAISLFVPVGIGLGFLVDGLGAAAFDVLRAKGGVSWWHGGGWLAPVALGGLCAVGILRSHVERTESAEGAAGGWRLKRIGNPATVVFEPQDWTGAAWVRRNTPTTARFLVSTAPWHLGTYRGLDGGYWLPVVAGRAASVPAALYTYGETQDVLAIQSLCSRAAVGDNASDRELSELMRDGGLDYVYVGPTSERLATADAVGGTGGAPFSAARLRRHPDLHEVYSSGAVSIFRFTDKVR